MSDKPNRVQFVIQKYRLAEITQVDAIENGAKLGKGKIMSDATLQRFMDSDPSGNFKYLDWMLFQAGGGQDAMDKSLQLWQGEGLLDANSLRNQCRTDYIEELVKGYRDERGVLHEPVSKAEAEAAWQRIEARSRFEFLMGDQDVAAEEGYGFFRNWPGKDGIYVKIVNAVKLWHMAQPKLLAQNQRHQRWMMLIKAPMAQWTKDDRAFMAKMDEVSTPVPVPLDIYDGWKPNEQSQSGATYKTLTSLLNPLAEVRRMQVLRDVRYESIYEDDLVQVVCPLTIGASIKFGIGKWCVCNRSEFDRSFDARTAATEGNWQRYCKQGPLVFLSWKCPMPAYLHRIAMHLVKLPSARVADVNWIDCQNEQKASNYSDILTRLASETDEATRRFHHPKKDVAGGSLTSASDERFYMWGGREPGPAWTTERRGVEIRQALDRAVTAVAVWARTFKPERIVLDYLTDVGSAVDKLNE